MADRVIEYGIRRAFSALMEWIRAKRRKNEEKTVAATRCVSNAEPAAAFEPILVACVRLADYELLLPFLARGGFRPVAALRDNPGEPDPSWPPKAPAFKDGPPTVPVLPVSELSRLSEEVRYDRVRVVIADVGDGTAFQSLGPRIAALLGEHQRLLHPAFLAEYIDHDLSRVVFCPGSPGSGNVVLQTIMARLLAPEREGRFDQMESWSASGHMLLCDLLTNAFKSMGAGSIEIGYSHPGFVTMVATFHDGEQRQNLYLPAVPSQIYMAEKSYGGHWPPRPEDARRIMHHRGRFALITRHPLDVVVSMAAKYASGPDKSIREKRTREKLADDQIFYSAVAEQLAFLKAAVRYRGTAKVLRYEDLLADPTGEIRRIAEFLEVPVDGAVVAELSALVGDVDLGGPEHHVFQPGAGKWKRLLTPDRINRVRQSGILDYAHAFGYSIDREPALFSSPDGRDAPTQHAVASFSHMFFLSDDEVRARVAEHACMTEVGGLQVTADNARLADLCVDALGKDRWLLQAVRSMSLGPASL